MTPDTVWCDAYEAGEGLCRVTAEGSYTIWLWAQPGAAERPSVTINGERYAPSDIPQGQEFQWMKAGEVALESGAPEITLDASVATLVLTTRTDYQPAAAAVHTRIFDQPARVDDHRHITDRKTNTIFNLHEFPNLEAWQDYRMALQKRFLVACGLWPMPERTPLNVQREVVEENADYVVEKVQFEAYPGFLVTGNLYRPVDTSSKYPGIANPHGHWDNGRLQNDDSCSVPGRCITFARMGMVAFSYDMVGYVDSLQFPKGWGHFGGQNPTEKLWGIHPFAIQLWSSIRVLDFLEGLEFVDPQNLNCTGASGGGTQTFALYTVDDRVKVAAPVNMISHLMQGGCTCENAPLIRINASNLEVGAMMAPRPLLMVSASGDWTRETLSVEFPSIRSIYQLYGAEDLVESMQVDSNHNYNRQSRETVYAFFGKHILGAPDQFAEFSEPPFEMAPADKLRLFPNDAPPAGLPNGEQIVAQLKSARRDAWHAIMPRSAGELEAFREQYGSALADVLGDPPASDPASFEVESVKKTLGPGVTVEGLIIKRDAAGQAVPALLYTPESGANGGVVMVHGQGKAALADLDAGQPGPWVRASLDRGLAVLTIDPFLIGEHNTPTQRTVRDEEGFLDTFMPTTTAFRVHDIIGAISALRARLGEGKDVSLIGLEKGGIWALFAAALDRRVSKLVVDADGFDNTSDAAWAETHYLPCVRAVGDVATAALMIAPGQILVMNTGGVFDAAPMTDACAAIGAPAMVHVHSTAVSPEDAARWLRQ